MCIGDAGERDWAHKSAEFSQIVSAMRLSSGERLKIAQVVLLCKLDVICLKSISNEVIVPSAEESMLVEMYQKRRYKDFSLLVGKIEPSI